MTGQTRRSRHDQPTAIELLERVADRTLVFDFSVWQWGDAIAIDGLLDASELLGSPRYRDFVAGFYRRWATRSLGWMDHLTPGAALLRLPDPDRQDSFLEAAERLAAWLRDVPHTEAGLPLYRPDVGTIRHSCWVDTIYHEPPFLLRLADMTGEDAHRAHAVSVWSSHSAALSSDQGPFLAHSFELASRLIRGYGWGRGNAWAILGMVDAIELMPEHMSDRAALVAEFESLAQAIADVQQPNGLWRTQLHDREAYLESSCTAMFGAAFIKARRLGLLPARFDEVAERAWSAALPYYDDEGRFFGVSAWTHAAINHVEDPMYYRTLPTEINWWGQGAALRAAAERVRAGLT